MLRERLKEMQIQISTQYFLWKRCIVLMRGKLARTESDKPVIKQEGVCYEHMRDMEFYYSDLEGLHDAVEKVGKTLDGAFDCLSRQVTICLPLKSIERYGNTETPESETKPHRPAHVSAPETPKGGESKVDELDDELDEFDSLKTSSDQKVGVENQGRFSGKGTGVRTVDLDKL